MAALNTLPNELLSLVASNLERPKDLVSLALSNRRLHEFTKLDGWKAFLKGRFRLTGLDSDARNAVHGLATLHSNWNRKGFVARYLEPSSENISINTWARRRWEGATVQTMGYRPSIDSYEEVEGAWTDRREVLAWSAGTQIALRITETGSKAARAWQEYQESEEPRERKGYVLDQFMHQNWWYTYTIPESIEGRDDITALELLRPHQKADSFEHIAYGTASGDLSLLSASPTLRSSKMAAYDTGERAVSSISISSANDPLMAATLGDSSLSLYTVVKHNQSELPCGSLSEVTPMAGLPTGRIWSCKFVADDKVAVGLGISHAPVHVYEITPSGFLSEPLRKFSLGMEIWDATTDISRMMRRSTSVYPVLPLPSDSHGGSDTSGLFLSGCYDGIVRLHDMRSPRNFESLFWDVTNDSSIYSLACHGLERFVVGSSMHSMLKVFDLRFPGSNAYHSIPVVARSRPKRQDCTYNAVVTDVPTASTRISGGWNLFLNPRNPNPQIGNRQQHNRRPREYREDSPVYSLSIPSSTSPNIYAGLEGAVQNLTFLSVTDQYPDPLLSQAITRFPDTNNIDIKTSYNPSDDVLNLGMYEQGNEDALGMQLLVQDGVRSGLVKNKERKDFARHRGLDDRWKDPTEDGERWVRGQEPQGNVRRGGWRGGGRGRGRARGRGRG
ncbi:hypothetical protein K458DRAFT_412980 [Lentithecium fluviatile CBS 122367]|uniref:F-box domain-containing protein n=1 Tax=Lentithecium fluviatile CBS 122367 TaxID=1168545 RepID=A0A6G1JHZ1_9PLEO|nr:hypothetical protein K458DRAFT_412980 [Lentithecium fluviatile CBS 122367]